MVTLCHLCQEVSDFPTDEYWEFRHYPTYRELKSSALAGCELCRLLRHAMLTQFTQRFGGSIESADRKELEIDVSDDAAPFYLTSHFVELVAEYSPYKRGLLGLMFIRADDDDEDKMAIGQWTLVFFEALVGSTSQTEGKVVGAPASSQADVSLARKWIRNCM